MFIHSSKFGKGEKHPVIVWLHGSPIRQMVRKWIKAVDNVSIQVGEGESLGLAGESGCEKTSLSLSIMRLLPLNGRILGGEIKFEDRDILNMNYKLFEKI